MTRLFTIIAVLLSLTVFAQPFKKGPSREELLNEKYCSALFSTADGIYFDLENDANTIGVPAYLNILDWLQGRVAGLQVNNYKGIRIPFLRNMPAAIYVDEMPVDASFLNMLPCTDIAMIKIIKGPFVGAWGANSTIAIYTKDGDEEELQ